MGLYKRIGLPPLFFRLFVPAGKRRCQRAGAERRYTGVSAVEGWEDRLGAKALFRVK